jgi:hypothetical protein
MDLKQGDHEDLLVLADDLSRTVYGDPAEHYRMHQLSALIRKYPALDLPGVQDPEEKAKKVFLSAEWRSKWTNRKFKAVRRLNSGVEASSIHTMRTWINYVLRNRADADQDGPAPTPDLQAIFEKCDFTGGASLGVHGNATNILRKLMQAEDGWTVTPEALYLAAEAVWNNFHITEFLLSNQDGKPVCLDVREFVDRFNKSVSLVCHNKIAFVPKTALVHRTIAAEPTLLTYLQKGIDLELRSALNRVGLDLSEQEPNQHLAWQGSFPDEADPYCTIDLSSASDTLATEVVRELLPPEWFELLDKCRSKNFLMPDGTSGRYEKFTSMGNGFCFPLQTLIFSSICHAAYAERGLASDFRVYGDDIIVRKSAFDRVIALLRFFGFVPNVRKTFCEGPFRESCGADWHSGLDVRPIFLDKRLETLESYFGFHNQSLRRGGKVADYFASIREWLYQAVPEPVRFVCDFDPEVPYGTRSGDTIDGAFWVPKDVVMASPLCWYNRQTWSWGYLALGAKPTVDTDGKEMASEHALEHATLMAALRGSPSESAFTLRYTPRYEIVRKNDGGRQYPRATPVKEQWWLENPEVPLTRWPWAKSTIEVVAA